jgi:hypothetical protein
VSDNYADWRERVASSCDPSFWPIDAIDSLLLSGDGQFWCDGDSALVTRIIAYPGGATAFECIAAVGNAEGLWKRIAPQVEATGRQWGLKRIYALGRLGWERHQSRPDGWERFMVCLVKDLGE